MDERTKIISDLKVEVMELRDQKAILIHALEVNGLQCLYTGMQIDFSKCECSSCLAKKALAEVSE